MMHHLTSEQHVRAIVRAADGGIQLRPVRSFGIEYTVERQVWLGRFQPAECRGLIDYLDEKAFTVSYLPLSEIPVQRDEQWEEIGDPALVAVSLRGTVLTTARYLIIQGSQVQEMNIRYLGPHSEIDKSPD